MTEEISDRNWLEELSPAQRWDEESTKRALDELFTGTRQYRSSQTFSNLLKFVSRFRFYSPYNSMLLHIQMPGAQYVAPAHRWLRDYDRTIKPNAQPLVILQPMGPVMFVFDVSDTIPGKKNIPLPPEVEHPFETAKGRVMIELDQTIENAKRDGIQIVKRKEGSQSAGSIRTVNKDSIPPQKFRSGRNDKGIPTYESVNVCYSTIINENLSREAQYATLIHELAHLYCGHIGTINPKWWPDRRGLNHQTCEFEAESVSYLICQRLGIESPSSQYLALYMKLNQEVPPISFECVMKVSGLIEQMGKQHIKPRKEKG